jgi:hypothetical protein
VPTRSSLPAAEGDHSARKHRAAVHSCSVCSIPLLGWALADPDSRGLDQRQESRPQTFQVGRHSRTDEHERLDHSHDARALAWIPVNRELEAARDLAIVRARRAGTVARKSFGQELAIERKGERGDTQYEQFPERFTAGTDEISGDVSGRVAAARAHLRRGVAGTTGCDPLSDDEGIAPIVRVFGRFRPISTVRRIRCPRWQRLGRLGRSPPQAPTRPRPRPSTSSRCVASHRLSCPSGPPSLVPRLCPLTPSATRVHRSFFPDRR